MPALIPSIPVIAQAIAVYLIPTGVSGWASALIIGGATLLGGYLSSTLYSKSQDNSADELRLNYVSTERNIPLLYGTRLVGGNLVFASVGTEGEGSNKGKYIWAVYAICEGPIEGMATINVDGTDYDEVYVNDKGIWEYKADDLKYWHKDVGVDLTGTSTQVCPSEITLGTGGKFALNMRNTAVTIVRYNAGKKRPFRTGVPKFQAVYNGKLCVDPRDVDPPAWTNNPVLALYDYMTNTRYGMGWEPDVDIDVDSIIEAANYCELTPASRPTSNLWEFNHGITAPYKVQSILDTFLQHFRGSFYEFNGIVYLRYLDLFEETPPSITITDAMVVRDNEGKPLVTASQPSRIGTPDGITVEYVDADAGWIKDRVNIGDVDGKANVKPISLTGFTNKAFAREMGTYILERERLNRTYTMVLRSDAIELDTGDLVYLSVSELGLSDQIARVTTNNIGADGFIHSTFILENEDLYDTFYNLDTSTVYEVSLPSISDNPPSVTNLQVHEHVYEYRERSFIRLSVTFDPPEPYPYFKHVRAYVYIGGSTPASEDDYVYLTSATTSFDIDPAEENKWYYIRLNSVSEYGVEQPDLEASRIGHLALGVSRKNPPCPTYLRAAVGLTSVDLVGDRTQDEVDISSFEFRMGTPSPGTPAWFNAVYLSRTGEPALSFNSVKPGEYTFWLNSRHKNGNFCISPKSDVAIIEEPVPGTVELYSQVIDYTTGTSTNMTVTGTYPNQIMYCSQIGSTSGEYVSTWMNTGNPDTSSEIMMYLLFNFEVQYDNLAWTNVLNPTSKTFTDLDASNISWSGFIAPDYNRPAARLEISFDYSIVDAAPHTPYKTVRRMELLSAMGIAKWVRVRYNIDDVSFASHVRLSASTFKAAEIEDNLLIT